MAAQPICPACQLQHARGPCPSPHVSPPPAVVTTFDDRAECVRLREAMKTVREFTAPRPGTALDRALGMLVTDSWYNEARAEFQWDKGGAP